MRRYLVEAALFLVVVATTLSGCLLDRSGQMTPERDAGSDAGEDAAAPRPDAGASDSGTSCRGGPERCDGADQDCDGRVDEDITPTDCTSTCGDGLTSCVAGTVVCGAPLPAEERCNGLDDDCDMRIDEDLFRGCETVCGSGTERCSGGRWLSCEFATGRDETCDGTDEDCDGNIDEDLTRSCTGACGGGVQVCSASVWGDCSASSGDELCNALDDDCDGAIDEGEACPCETASTATLSYLFCDFGVDWANAQVFCASRGYALASIGSTEMNTWVTDQALTRVDGEWWIGLNDRAAEGTWVWASGRVGTYTNFHVTQPNSSLGEQDCATLDNGDQVWEGRGQWGDRDCSSALPFVCDAPR